MTKKDLKIVFFGTPEFAVASLDKLVMGGYNIAAVVTMPDKPAGRGQQILQSDIKKYAVAHNLPVLQPEKLKAEDFVDELRRINADLFIVIAFRMLPEVVWQMPKYGTFNLHASLLPKYRGAAPLNWAVINGDKETGVTTFFLKHEIDTGDIIQQKRITIEDSDNAGTVHDKLMTLGADMVIETVDAIIAGTVATIPQDQLCKSATPTPAPKIFKETCHIDWNNPAEKIHNLVRGLSPYPAAWSTFEKDGKEHQLKIFETALTGMSADGAAPGTVKTDKNNIYVACADNYLQILSLQQSGKKRMDSSAFLRGSSLADATLK